ncbi:hypothetical protein B0O99DRAFT_677534 [Bisporella sp. PMI_857]|nr:hypothetical protein B0O99DRAFT_677534 [Bisporella sp. PMI_857]
MKFIARKLSVLVTLRLITISVALDTAMTHHTAPAGASFDEKDDRNLDKRDILQLKSSDAESFERLVEDNSAVKDDTENGPKVEGLATDKPPRLTIRGYNKDIPVGPNFGMSLEAMTQAAGTLISVYSKEHHSKGLTCVAGYIPSLVANCCALIKAGGKQLLYLFASDNNKRLSHFSEPTYLVGDSASLLRKLVTLFPEPLVPFKWYNSFIGLITQPPWSDALVTSPDLPHAQSEENRMQCDEILIHVETTLGYLPFPNCPTLLYILDVLAESAENEAEIGELVAMFQPGLLSLPSSRIASHDYRLAHQVLVFMLRNWDSLWWWTRSCRICGEKEKATGHGLWMCCSISSSSKPISSRQVMGMSTDVADVS